ncbi:hypothetical protein DPEC_G00313510 [Dallia pectoralis]|uniref:Uncharacterized protein n=1 Tax=Dallia pectoralis TaxID=75939 RepID=A0ACC2FBW5_DALPE|nr:hypothetical protein DPEC_G00313510 [Dallia pectoralis]
MQRCSVILTQGLLQCSSVSYSLFTVPHDRAQLKVSADGMSLTAGERRFPTRVPVPMRSPSTNVLCDGLMSRPQSERWPMAEQALSRLRTQPEPSVGGQETAIRGA